MQKNFLSQLRDLPQRLMGKTLSPEKESKKDIIIIPTYSASRFHSPSMYSNQSIIALYIFDFLLDRALGFDVPVESLKHCLIHSKGTQLLSSYDAFRTTTRTDQTIMGGSEQSTEFHNELEDLTESVNSYLTRFDSPYTIICDPKSLDKIDEIIRNVGSDPFEEWRKEYNLATLEPTREGIGVMDALLISF